MKNTQRKLTLMMAILLVFGLILTGCAPKAEEKPQAAAQPAATETPATGADASWSNVEKKGELVVGLCAAYPPFESRNAANGKIEGFDVDLANAIGAKLGVKVKVVDAEWTALLGGMNKGDYDVLVTCMSKKEASVENVNMSDVYYNLNDVVALQKDNTTIKSLKDLEGKVVGVQLGSGSEQLVDKMKGLKEIKRYNYNPEAFLDLKNKRIDAVIVGYAYAVDQISGDPSYKTLEEPVGSSEIVMVSKAGGDTLTAKLNEGLKAIKEDKTYDTLIEKWLSMNKKK